MNDFIFISLMLVVFWSERSVFARLRIALGGNMETLIAGGIALALFIYLFVAMLRPEIF